MVDQVRPRHRDMRSTRLVDQIYPEHLDPPKKISDIQVFIITLYNC